MKNTIFLVFAIWSLNLFAQKEDYYKVNPVDSTWEHVRSIHHVDLRRSFGIYPEIQFINSPVIGISASLARLLNVEWSAFSRGVNAGFEFDPIQKYYGPKVSVWGDLFAIFIGGNVGVSMMYYRQNNVGGLYLRPEIGLGIPRLHLKYGFGFRMAGDEVTGFQRHSLTLGYHFTLWRKDLQR